jgi:hypothetical protein
MSRARDLADGTFSGAFSADSPTLVVDATNNLVGVGTTSPSSFNVNYNNLVVGSGSGFEGITIYTDTASSGGILFADGTTGTQPYEGQLKYQHASNVMTFHTNGGIERLRIQSGGGISFNGDTAAANALDDYEWGTFTPSVGGTTSDPTQSYAGRGGYYVKIGNLVHVNGWIDFAAGVSAGSGDMQLRGFPFTVINNIPSSRGAVHLAEMVDFNTANQGAPMFGFLENNGTTAVLQVYPNHTGKTGSAVPASAADIISRSRFSFNCTYVTA